MQERRSSRRYPVVLAAEAVLNNGLQRYQGVVTDISFSGVRFLSGQRIDKDQQLELAFSIEDQDIKLNAVVTRLAQEENSMPIQHGLKITGVVFEGDRKRLEKFFQGLQEKNVF